MRSDVTVGMAFPDHELADHAGRDWDLSDPEVRAAWQRGEVDRFYAPELGWPPRVAGEPGL